MSRHTITNADSRFAGPAQLNGANQGLRGLPFSLIAKILFLSAAGAAPAAASATAIVNAAAVAGAGAVAISGTLTPNAVFGQTAYIVDVARTLQYVSSNAGDTTQTVTVRGYDMYGEALSEAVTLTGTGVVHGKKAFSYVVSVTASAALAGTLSVGTDTKLGLQYALSDKTQLVQAYENGSPVLTVANFTAADTTSPATSSTGDVRGLWNPTSAPDGTKKYVLWRGFGDETIVSGSPPRYTDIYGQAQA